MRSGILLRTNPRLTGNLKLVISDQIWLESIGIGNLQNSKFKKQNISINSDFGTDVTKFLQNGLLPKEEFYEIKRLYSDTSVSDNIDHIVETTYNSGAQRSNQASSFEFSYSAPLYLGNSIPKKFIILKSDASGNLSEMIKESDIVFQYDLVKSGLRGYIEKYWKKINQDSVFVDFKNKEISYFGLDARTGVLSSIKEKTDLFDQEQSQFDLEKYVTEGFYRNYLLYPRILNLEFEFNDLNKYESGRYFGLFVDDFDLGFGYLNNTEPEILNYNSKPEFVDSISLFDIEGIDMEDIPINDGVFLTYLKDKSDSLVKVYNKNANEISFKNPIDKTNFISVESKLATECRLIDKINAFGYLEVLEEAYNSLSISYWKNNRSICTVYADNLLTYDGVYGIGLSHGHYFHPSGTQFEIAKGIASAFNTIFKERNIFAKAIAIDQFVFIEEEIESFKKSEIKVSDQTIIKTFPFSKKTSSNRSIEIVKNIDFKLERSFLPTKLGYSRIFDRRLNINPDTFELTELISVGHTDVLKSDDKVEIFESKKIKFGYVKFFEVYDLDMDTDIQIINYDKNQEIDTLKSIYPTDEEILKLQKFELENIEEYNRFRDNERLTNLFDSKIVPYITKFVKNGTDIKSNSYRLNNNLAYGVSGLSPSFNEKNQNPKEFTHEFFYIAGVPDYISTPLVLKYLDYIEEFDVTKYLDNKLDYFYKVFSPSKIGTLHIGQKKMFSEIKFVSENRYQCFFRGINIEFESATDISNWKFSAVITHRPTDLNKLDKPVSIKLLQNEKYKNVVLNLEITSDDYKKINMSYAYLYAMESIKNSGNYGYQINLPTIPGITMKDANGVNITNFFGVQLPFRPSIAVPDNLVLLDGRYPNLEIGYHNAVNGNYLGFIGMKGTDIICTFKNMNTSTGIYEFIEPSTKNLNSYSIELVDDGICAVNVSGVFLPGNVDAYPLDYQFIKFKDLIWYLYNGGYRFYEEIVKLISFSGIYDIIANNSIYFKNETDKKIKFVKPDQISLSSTKLIEEKIDDPNLISEQIFDYKLQKDQQIKIQRYGGFYDLLLKKTINFDPLDIDIRLDNTIKTLEEINESFLDLQNNFIYSDIFESFGIPTFDYNIAIWMHKYGEIKSTQNPIYPSNLLIEKVIVNPFNKPSFKYHLDNFESIEKDTEFEMKWFMGTILCPVDLEFKINAIDSNFDGFNIKFIKSDFIKSFFLGKGLSIEFIEKNLINKFYCKEILFYKKRNYTTSNNILNVIPLLNGMKKDKNIQIAEKSDVVDIILSDVGYDYVVELSFSCLTNI